jgi:hypothetical protein
MSRAAISASLRAAVREPANHCCEYCRLRDLGAFFPPEVDHIIALQHGGQTELENLALACMQCNRAKGTNFASFDPETRRQTPLFNPRRDRWLDHFQLDGPRIIALTAVGRVTLKLLNIGDEDREATRRELWRDGRYPD